MLRVYLGEMETANYGPSWFKYNYHPEWLTDPFVQQMIEDVDHSRYVDGLVIDSPVLGPIPPERLSGGLKTLIMIYERPDLVFDATSCGDNCAKWLLEIGHRKDVLVNLNYLMVFKEYEPFQIYIENENKLTENYKDFLFTAAKYL